MRRIHDTPRTDAVLNTFNGAASKLAADLATHAEQLERELGRPTDLPDANTTAHARVNWWKERCDCLHEALSAERALADKLANILEDIAFGTVIKRAAGGCGQTQLWTAPQMAQHAAEALAAWKAARTTPTDDQA